jgi:hypothetical protein
MLKQRIGHMLLVAAALAVSLAAVGAATASAGEYKVFEHCPLKHARPDTP